MSDSQQEYLKVCLAVRKYLLYFLKVNSTLQMYVCCDTQANSTLLAAPSTMTTQRDSSKCCQLSHTGKGVPIFILSLSPLRPPGTSLSTEGMLLNSIAFRQALTQAF